jgi:hypothetical protein
MVQVMVPGSLSGSVREPSPSGSVVAVVPPQSIVDAVPPSILRIDRDRDVGQRGVAEAHRLPHEGVVGAAGLVVDLDRLVRLTVVPVELVAA